MQETLGDADAKDRTLQINLVFGFHTVFAVNCKMPDKVMLASQSCLMDTYIIDDGHFTLTESLADLVAHLVKSNPSFDWLQRWQKPTASQEQSEDSRRSAKRTKRSPKVWFMLRLIVPDM